ncbi:MAG: pilus assembly protein TadG-related protein [Pseudomonadota bacterium]
MRCRPINPPQSRRAALLSKKRLAKFERDEEGSFIIFSLMMFTLMLLVAGISLDIERFETARTKLQNTADAAALAAASLTQNHFPKQEIVEDFFEKANMGTFLEDIDIDTAINATRVTVEADVNVPTHFFNMIGVNNLATRVTSVAAEAIGDVEVSLVLDVSGSMGSNNKLTNLKNAADEFIDAMYLSAAPGSVSISVVPYATQVSAGPEILQHFTSLNAAHDESHCLNMSQFNTTALSPTDSARQTLAFDPWTRHNQGFSPLHSLWRVVCRSEDWLDILPFSEDINELKDYINAFQATDWTSIELGVKWGAALLDPAFRPVVDALIDDNVVGSAFSGRPSNFDQADALKVIVVMSDGQNTEHWEMKDPYRTGDSFVYVYYDNNDRPYFSIWDGNGEPNPNVQFDSDGDPINNWYLANDYSNDGVSDGWRSTPFGGGNATRMTWTQLWAELPVRFFTDRYLKDAKFSNNTRNKIKNARKKFNRNAKDSNTRKICTAAKDNGILIYAIGFEAPSSAEKLLKECSNSAAHFFDVDGVEISTAFNAIAADIARLRLLQ